jgi:transcriptional repressor NrdR
MFCPYCKHSETKVTDKRDSEGETRRRRECLKCNKRFTTYEKTEPPDIKVVKKDGSRQIFSREKLKLGIIKALEKRPVSTEQVDKLLADIELKLEPKGKEVSSKEIGELVMRGLRKLDKVAYIRFASVYRDFQDVDDFKDAVKEVG